MNQDIKSSEVEKLVGNNHTLAFDVALQKELTLSRNAFRDAFPADKIRGLALEAYFQGRGVKDGNFTYELEWKTRHLGSIRGGSNFKFGYEQDFARIKEFIAFIVSQNSGSVTFYNADGTLANVSKQMVDRSKTIKGLKSGRTTIGKILSIYFPDVFVNIFTDQDHFLSKLYSDYEVETKGLESFLINNFLLLRVKEKIMAVLPNDQAPALTNDRFAHLLYKTYPKDKVAEPTGELTQEAPEAEQPFNALEVQHYQTLVHRNFRRLFPTLRYYDEASQNEVSGHYDTQEIGILDFLAVDDHNNLIVIELKRRASDQTLGQLLRYMGWVREILCEDNQEVKGMILADTVDVKLDYALNVVSGVEIRRIKLDIEII